LEIAATICSLDSDLCVVAVAIVVVTITAGLIIIENLITFACNALSIGEDITQILTEDDFCMYIVVAGGAHPQAASE
jgi:hypothetical protein